MSLLATSHAKQRTQIAELRSRNENLEAEVTALKQRNRSGSLKVGGHDVASGMKEQSKPHKRTFETEPFAYVIPRTNFQQHKRGGDVWYSPPSGVQDLPQSGS